MGVTPILVQTFVPPASAIAEPKRQQSSFANLVIAAGLLVSVIVVQPWVKPYLGLPATYQSLFAPVPGAPQLFSDDTPVAAVADLRTTPCVGRIFNEMGAGSYMAWALYPVSQYYIDPRIELFELSIWERYIAVGRGQDAQVFFDEQQVGCVVLDTQAQRGLAQVMPTLQGWTRTLKTERSELWRRNIQ